MTETSNNPPPVQEQWDDLWRRLEHALNEYEAATNAGDEETRNRLQGEINQLLREIDKLGPNQRQRNELLERVKQFKELHPLLQGLGILVGAPLAIAGGAIFAAGTVLYGAGQAVGGVGSLLTGGALGHSSNEAQDGRR